MYDANSQLQAPVTKTTTFNGAGFDLGTGTPVRGLKARILIASAASVATSGTVFQFSIDHSTDNTTFYTIGECDPITAGTAGVAYEKFIYFSTRQRYVRASCTLSPSSGTPAIAYSAELGIAAP